jgi:hypothetical protein
MTVPTRSEVIRASELVPGQPVTADLLNRMYANAFAVFGLDPDSATVPIFSFPPSLIELKNRTHLTGIASSYTSYCVVSNITDSLETIIIQGGTVTQSNYGSSKIAHFFEYNSGAGYYYKIYSIETISVNYSSGAPTSVIIDGVTVPLNDSETTITSNGGAEPFVYAKAKVMSGQVLVAFRCVGLYSPDPEIDLAIELKAYKNKAAP